MELKKFDDLKLFNHVLVYRTSGYTIECVISFDQNPSR